MAVAALRHVTRDPSTLHSGGFAAGHAFNGRDLAITERRHWKRAGPQRFAVEKYRAGATHGDATAKLGAAQTQAVAQYPQQWRVRQHVNAVAAAVDLNVVRRHSALRTFRSLGSGWRVPPRMTQRASPGRASILPLWRRPVVRAGAASGCAPILILHPR